MAGRELEAVQRAVDRYVAGETVLAASKAEGVNSATLNRALNRRGIEKRGSLKGEAHPAYIDGRTAVRRERRQGRAAAATP